MGDINTMEDIFLIPADMQNHTHSLLGLEASGPLFETPPHNN